MGDMARIYIPKIEIVGRRKDLHASRDRDKLACRVALFLKITFKSEIL